MTTLQDTLTNHSLRELLRQQLRTLDLEVVRREQELRTVDEELANATAKQVLYSQQLEAATATRDALSAALEASNVTRYCVELGVDHPTPGHREHVIEAAAFDTPEEAEAWAKAAIGKAGNDVLQMSTPPEIITMCQDEALLAHPIVGWTVEVFTHDEGTTDSWNDNEPRF